jgi:hypothetical protein
VELSHRIAIPWNLSFLSPVNQREALESFLRKLNPSLFLPFTLIPKGALVLLPRFYNNSEKYVCDNMPIAT